jgi:hypothetical protein
VVQFRVITIVEREPRRFGLRKVRAGVASVGVGEQVLRENVQPS